MPAIAGITPVGGRIRPTNVISAQAEIHASQRCNRARSSLPSWPSVSERRALSPPRGMHSDPCLRHVCALSLASRRRRRSLWLARSLTPTVMPAKAGTQGRERHASACSRSEPEREANRSVTSWLTAAHIFHATATKKVFTAFPPGPISEISTGGFCWFEQRPGPTRLVEVP